MLTLLLAILIVLLGLLAIPVGLDYQVNWRGKLQGEIDLSWLFGLLHVRIPMETTTSPSSDQQTHAKPKRRHKPKSRRRAKPLAAWRLRPFRRRLLRFVRDLWRAIHKRDLRVQLRIGLGDPADTGQLWALMGPLSAVLTQSESVAFELEPDFMDSSLDFASSGRIRIIPLQLLGLTLALLLSPPFWQGVRRMRSAG